MGAEGLNPLTLTTAFVQQPVPLEISVGFQKDAHYEFHSFEHIYLPMHGRKTLKYNV